MIDAVEIMPGLWLGSFPTTGDLAQLGFDVLAVVAKEHATPGLASQFPGVRVLLAPLEDKSLDEGAVQQAISIARAAHALWKAGRRVLIVCHMGINRSALVTAMVLHIARGISGAEAVQAVRRARPGSLSNSSFLAYLLRIPRRES